MEILKKSAIIIVDMITWNKKKKDAKDNIEYFVKEMLKIEEIKNIS